ncbi:BQ5605_C032g11101 [Microbotryum silenes-dioicae]|uniref:BQ5605_C032g11101 protein n=1 Tax=Microbotryum silenes-dioicae TaxID=796604 RepID=A0A2X0MK37_9BASI|nr:BQ5605_C032g11101 [Microbotryum silenes-dioicae]
MTRRLARIAAAQADLFARFRLHKLSLCQYLSWYFSLSTQHDGAHNHRTKLFNSDWTQLKHVLDLIIQLAREDGPDARGRINNWIANQSDSIIVKEMKRTKSVFVSSHDMAPEVLASDQIDVRLDAFVESNSFISGRIRNLLSHCGDPPPVEESNCDKLSSDSTDVDMEDAQEDSSGSDAERGPLVKVKLMMAFIDLPQLCRSTMGRIVFACNRRNNAKQHHNGLMALACGANDRLTTPARASICTGRGTKSSPKLSTKRSLSFLRNSIGSTRSFELIVICTDHKGDSLNSIDGDQRGVPLTGVGVCTGMVDHEGGSDVVDWRCGPKVRPVRRGWLIHVGAKNGPSGSVREPAPSRK